MKKKKPNLLFVFADQWRRHAVGFMNEDPVITPNIDKFSQESLVFDNAISCCPLCSPHRAALLTGRYPISTGVFTNCKIGCDARLKEKEICISDVLKSVNYNTAYIGKWHLDLPELNSIENPKSGAKGWDAYTPPGAKRHGFDFWHVYNAMNEHLHPHYWENTPKKIEINQWSPEHETDVAIEYIKEKCNDDNPFALFISWNPPHSPYNQVPEKYKDLYKDKKIKLRKNVKTENIMCHTHEKWNGGEKELIQATKDYYAAVTGLDENFGRLLKTLNDLGVADNTIIVLSADHGDLMGSHGLMAKHVWYEESIGIPFLIRWPEHINRGKEKTLLNSVDVMPTLLGLMDVEIPDTVEGMDISSTIKGNENVEISSAYIHAYPGREVFLKEYEKVGIDPKTKGWRGVRTQGYTYVVHKGYWPDDNIEERYLYELKNDPYQLNPIKINNAEERKVTRKLEKELKQWLIKTKDPFQI